MIQSQGKGSNLKGAILDQMIPKSIDFNFNRFSLNLNGFGWIQIWIWMDLHPQLGLLCGAALPGAFFSRKNTSLVFLQPKSMVLAFW